MSSELASETLSLLVNGAEHRLPVGRDTRLLYLLRNDLGLNGPKFGCGLGECGACAVLIGDRVVRSCCLPAGAAEGRPVTTLEGLTEEGAPGPAQRAFIAEQAAQCGYCLNGMIIAAEALRRRAEPPDEDAIRAALAHHLCRCGTHVEILRAVRRALAS